MSKCNIDERKESCVEEDLQQKQHQQHYQQETFAKVVSVQDSLHPFPSQSKDVFISHQRSIADQNLLVDMERIFENTGHLNSPFI